MCRVFRGVDAERGHPVAIKVLLPEVRVDPEVRMRFVSPTHVDILQSIPGTSKADGYTVVYQARNADEAYRLIRLMYRFVRQ